MRVPKTLQLARDEHDDNTAELQLLVMQTAQVERLAWRAAGAGAISARGLREIIETVRALHSCSARILERNQLIASLLCATAGGLNIQDPRTLQRLPALRMLEPEPEEDWAA